MGRSKNTSKNGKASGGSSASSSSSSQRNYSTTEMDVDVDEFDPDMSARSIYANCSTPIGNHAPNVNCVIPQGIASVPASTPERVLVPSSNSAPASINDNGNNNGKNLLIYFLPLTLHIVFHTSYQSTRLATCLLTVYR